MSSSGRSRMSASTNVAVDPVAMAASLACVMAAGTMSTGADRNIDSGRKPPRRRPGPTSELHCTLHNVAMLLRECVHEGHELTCRCAAVPWCKALLEEALPFLKLSISLRRARLCLHGSEVWTIHARGGRFSRQRRLISSRGSSTESR